MDVHFVQLDESYLGFTLGAYDRNYPVTIDPTLTLTWNTFLGADGGGDYPGGVAVDASGNVYITGTGPATWGSPVRDYTAGDDVFVAKLSSDGTLSWNTFLGGSATDVGHSIAVDGSGNVYVTGASGATWGDDPVRAYTAGMDAFAAKLDSDGALTWHTFLGSSASDYGNAIAVDAGGSVYIGGSSSATWGDSPVQAHSGSSDAFAAKLGSDGALTWLTFLGGSSSEVGYGIGLDTGGNVYVGGYSTATWGDDPVRAYSGGRDPFAAKLGSNGALIWNTFLGSSGYDDVGFSGIAVDTSGSVYISGESDATWGDSPVRTYTGGYEGFAAKIETDGTLSWNTFLGGSDYDRSDSIAVDASGNVYVSGWSFATWGDSPVSAYTDNGDAFVAILDGTGTLSVNTFLGGSDYDGAYAIAVDGNSNVYVGGESYATWGDSPVNAFTSNSNTFAARVFGGEPTAITLNEFTARSDGFMGRGALTGAAVLLLLALGGWTVARNRPVEQKAE